MILFLTKLKSNFIFSKINSLIILRVVRGIAKVLINRAIFLISGILAIKKLLIKEYPLYTFANTTFGAIVLIFQKSIPLGVLAQGTKLLQNNVRFGEVIVTGFNLRAFI